MEATVGQSGRIGKTAGTRRVVDIWRLHEGYGGDYVW